MSRPRVNPASLLDWSSSSDDSSYEPSLPPSPTSSSSSDSESSAVSERSLSSDEDALATLATTAAAVSPEEYLSIFNAAIQSKTYPAEAIEAWDAHIKRNVKLTLAQKQAYRMALHPPAINPTTALKPQMTAQLEAWERLKSELDLSMFKASDIIRMLKNGSLRPDGSFRFAVKVNKIGNEPSTSRSAPLNGAIELYWKPSVTLESPDFGWEDLYAWMARVLKKVVQRAMVDKKAVAAQLRVTVVFSHDHDPPGAIESGINDYHYTDPSEAGGTILDSIIQVPGRVETTRGDYIRWVADRERNGSDLRFHHIKHTILFVHTVST